MGDPTTRPSGKASPVYTRTTEAKRVCPRYGRVIGHKNSANKGCAQQDSRLSMGWFQTCSETN